MAGLARCTVFLKTIQHRSLVVDYERCLLIVHSRTREGVPEVSFFVVVATSQTAKETLTAPPILRSLSGLLSAVHNRLRDTTNSTAQIADVEVQLPKWW